MELFAEIFSNVQVGIVPLILITLGLVEFSKRLGLEGKALLVEAMVIGVVFYGAQMLAEMYPVIAPWVQLIVFGLGGGLATTGLYDFSKKFKPDAAEQ